jgi:hypothetical protein
LYKHGGSKRFEEYYVMQAGTLDAEEGKKGIDIELPEEEFWTDCRAGWLAPVAGMKQVGGFN